MKPQKLNKEQTRELIDTLKERFESNTARHKGIKWADVEERLKTNNKKLPALHQMEATGGEPDVIGFDKTTGEYIFFDCSAESPKGRRSVCYDAESLASRKEHKPKHSALGMAAEMGIQILTEEEYRKLQTLGEFDLKTSSWVATPADIRQRGGGMFCDRRYDTLWTYHNGAESYYAARGWRGSLRV